MCKRCSARSYPATATISGTLNGGGTSAAPVLDANLILDDIHTKGLHFDRMSGELHLARDEVRLSHAELGREYRACFGGSALSSQGRNH